MSAKPVTVAGIEFGDELSSDWKDFSKSLTTYEPPFFYADAAPQAEAYGWALAQAASTVDELAIELEGKTDKDQRLDIQKQIIAEYENKTWGIKQDLASRVEHELCSKLQMGSVLRGHIARGLLQTAAIMLPIYSELGQLGAYQNSVDLLKNAWDALAKRGDEGFSNFCLVLKKICQRQGVIL